MCCRWGLWRVRDRGVVREPHPMRLPMDSALQGSRQDERFVAWSGRSAFLACGYHGQVKVLGARDPTVGAPPERPLERVMHMGPATRAAKP